MIDADLKCPCNSGKLYRECCAPFHQGKEAGNAVALMRSRYSAYAMNNVDYIVRTTHPRNPVLSHLDTWKQEILNFSLNTDFVDLEILDSKEQKDRATVVFIAHLEQDGRDATFTERSYFAKVDGKWYYVNGDTYPGEERDVRA